MKRKRGHISLKTKLAAALSMLMHQEDRDYWRRAKAPAAIILALFDFDHVVLHAHDGDDEWHNLTPMRREPHREKSHRDTSIVAKTKRLRQAPTVIAGKPKTNGVHIGPEVEKRIGDALARPGRPKARIPSRINPWPPKGSRPFARKSTKVIDMRAK